TPTLVSHGYTVEDGYAWRIIHGTYFEGHCLEGGESCIDQLILMANTLGLIPLTTVDEAVPHNRRVSRWLKRRKGFVQIAENNLIKVLAIPKEA
ncbi:MAG: hypothetical protein ACRCZ2_12675, partial [Fusobacteriaceae bacterium]